MPHFYPIAPNISTNIRIVITRVVLTFPITHTKRFTYNILSSANTFTKLYRGVDIFMLIIKRECINGSGCVVLKCILPENNHRSYMQSVESLVICKDITCASSALLSYLT